MKKLVDKERTLSSMSCGTADPNSSQVDRITHPYLVSVANAIRDSILERVDPTYKIQSTTVTTAKMIVILTRRMVARERTRR